MARLVCSLLLAAMALAGPSIAAASSATLSGVVRSGATPLAGMTVTLYRAGATTGAKAQVLATDATDAGGAFDLSYAPGAGSSVLYLLAERAGKPGHGGSPVTLAAMLGRADEAPVAVVVNERTTVAAAWAMAQFAGSAGLAGKAPGLQIAAATAGNIADVTTGGTAAAIATPLNTTVRKEVNTLANLLARCVGATDAGPCDALFGLAKPKGGARPKDTVEAALAVARNPANNLEPLFDLAQASTAYQPALTELDELSAWTLAILYVGNGTEFDGPGNMVIDAKGNLWITNNYDGAPNACGGQQLLKLTPTGADAPGAPFSGGGLYGAGFGIAIDPRNHLWVGNFGFEGSNCATPFAPNSISEFLLDGTALSPDYISGLQNGGYQDGNIRAPQGTVSDQAGNIWIANYGQGITGIGSSITIYPNGQPSQALNFDVPYFLARHAPIHNPFGVAIDAQGDAWVASSGNDSVLKLHLAGHQLAVTAITGAGISRPLATAVDSRGNIWIVNSAGNSVTALSPKGKPLAKTPYTGGGVALPWGVAVDGNDQVWVANFTGQAPRLSVLCGARPATCPPGLATGDPISPPSGYLSDSLQRQTGIVIDSAGNVWLADNWRRIPEQANPGGIGMVEFIGLAGPVKHPRIGPPEQP